MQILPGVLHARGILSPRATTCLMLAAPSLADNRVIFNIGGNSFRLVVKVRYQGGIVLVEWVGTHAEYDKARL